LGPIEHLPEYSEVLMSDRASMDNWVKRVLGLNVPAGQPEPGGLDQELQTWRQDILDQAGMLADKSVRARIEQLGSDAAAAIADGSLGAAHSILDAMDTALNDARRAQTNRSAVAESGNKVEYAKLLLRWRESQSSTRERIEQLAASILADPEVQADPRFEDVVEAAADLVDVMPGFGRELEDVLDGLDKLTDPDQRAAQVEAARAQIDACRNLLDSADELAELSQFAGEEYGEADLAGDLREALTELAGALAGRV
jgi:hypothetical protein